MNSLRFLVAAAVGAAWLWTFAAHAAINPRFTPIHLVKQSTLIVSVDLKQGASPDLYEGDVREVLKGKTDKKSFRFDISTARNEEAANALRSLAAAQNPALFFVGEFGEGDGGEETLGYLHVSGKWALLVSNEDGQWLFDNIDKAMQATWAGGTDMLRRAMDYALQDDDPDVPAIDGVAWSPGPMKIATLGGKIRSVRPVDLSGDGTMVLHVACDQGDHLLACDAKTRNWTDVTAARGLQARSQAFAWGDFAGQGRLDLVSFDGKAFSLHAQQADGTFLAKPLDLGAAAADGCLGLTAVDAGIKGRCGLLVSGNAWPWIVALDPAGKAAATPLAAAGLDAAKLGKAGPCLVADFDGDGHADVLALRESGSAWFRGAGGGRFGPGAACAVSLGPGLTGACLGDFDGDGRLDVLTFNSQDWSLWENEGAGKFTGQSELTGEFAYTCVAVGSDCMTGDINNDGRQDILAAYRGASPYLFFNRGFRSFGLANTLDIGAQHLLQEADDAKGGQQSACLGDFDGDGAQDMALALANGEVWVLFRENGDEEARMAVAVLPVAGGCKGPVTVTGWIGKRCLGAWNVAPGVSQACVARRDAGPVTLTWRLPGGEPQEREIILENGGISRVEIK
jgi:hypothetical protein